MFPPDNYCPPRSFRRGRGAAFEGVRAFPHTITHTNTAVRVNRPGGIAESRTRGRLPLENGIAQPKSALPSWVTIDIRVAAPRAARRSSSRHCRLCFPGRIGRSTGVQMGLPPRESPLGGVRACACVNACFLACCVRASVCVCLCACVRACMFVLTCARERACLRACVYVRACMLACLQCVARVRTRECVRTRACVRACESACVSARRCAAFTETRPPRAWPTVSCRLCWWNRRENPYRQGCVSYQQAVFRINRLGLDSECAACPSSARS